jgi:hypothetical protein
MNNLVNLMSMVGVEKTLIIACGEYGLNKQIEFKDRIFIYVLSESMLQNQNPLEKGRIQYYIESKECKQVIIVGSVEQNLIGRIIQNESDQSPFASLKFNLAIFLRNQNKAIVPTVLRDQMLIELHVTAQCAMLMDYYFVRERIENSELQVRGFVTEPGEENLKPIFCNGTIYNTIISMN